jgi:hypothetical protein
VKIIVWETWPGRSPFNSAHSVRGLIVVDLKITSSAIWLWTKAAESGSFISKSGSAWVAICSLVVAGSAFYYTKNAQEQDFYYRELLIKPVLIYKVSPENHSVELINQGLGPAVIKDVAWQMDNKCFVSNGLDPETWERNRKLFSDFLNTYFFDNVAFATKTQEAIGPRPPTYGIVPTPGELLAVGKSIELFGVINPAQFTATLNKLSREQREAFDNAFSDRLYSLKLLVGYCSVSGKNCFYSTVLALKPHVCG